VAPATKLIALSHVAWTSGQVMPVRELAELGIPVLVDGAQAVGAIPVAVEETGAAFYAFSGQKWLLGPGATGGLYVAPASLERLGVIAPSYYSQQGYDERGAFVPRDGARRFDGGWLSRGVLEGLLASLAFLDEAGEWRFALALEQTAYCRELLSRRVEVVTAPGQATLVSWASPDAPAESRRLAERGVVVRSLPSLPWVRASIGFWTSDGDLEALAAALDDTGG
jgi:L-cysteine/cystine lyase